MEFGVSQGWWEEYDDIGPFKTIRVDSSNYTNKKMSHIMVDAGLFTSLNQARSAGWDKDVVVGRHLIKKRRVIVEVR